MTFTQEEIIQVRNEINNLNQCNTRDTINNLDYFCEKIKAKVSGVQVLLDACQKIDKLNDDAMFLQEETTALGHEINSML